MQQLNSKDHRSSLPHPQTRGKKMMNRGKKRNYNSGENQNNQGKYVKGRRRTGKQDRL
jgi:hypothetical protein